MFSNECLHSIPTDGHVTPVGVFVFEKGALNLQGSPESHHNRQRG